MYHCTPEEHTRILQRIADRTGNAVLGSALVDPVHLEYLKTLTDDHSTENLVKWKRDVHHDSLMSTWVEKTGRTHDEIAAAHHETMKFIDTHMPDESNLTKYLFRIENIEAILGVLKP